MSQSAAKIIGWILITAALLLAGAAAFFINSPLQYVVYADDEPHIVRGSFETVDDVVAASGIVLQRADDISPSLSDSASEQTPIQIRAAREVVLFIDDDRQPYVSNAPTIGRFLAENNIELLSTDRIIAGSRPIGREAITHEPLPVMITIQRAMDVTIVEGEDQATISTAAQTVGEALSEAGIELFAADRTTPPQTAPLTPDLTIVLNRAVPVTIQVDGQRLETRTPAGSVAQLLAETGVGLVGFDFTIPPLNAPVTENAEIQVVRVNESFIIEDHPIPFDSLLQPSADLEIDQRALLQNGVPGVERRRIRIRYENGIEVSRTSDASWVAQAPVSEVVGYGTTVILRTVETEQGPREYWRKVTMRVTSYMAQTSGKPKDHPGYGITASGRVAGYGIVAIDPRVVPFRSELFVPGYGVAFAGDTGGGVKGRWIDLGYEDNWDTFKSWNGTVEVYYLTPVPEKINYLIPRVIP